MPATSAGMTGAECQRNPHPASLVQEEIRSRDEEAMPETQAARRSDESRSRRSHHAIRWDEVRLEGVHAERERQRMIQRGAATRVATADSNEQF
jgi:hypothetical protein